MGKRGTQKIVVLFSSKELPDLCVNPTGTLNDWHEPEGTGPIRESEDKIKIKLESP